MEYKHLVAPLIITAILTFLLLVIRALSFRLLHKWAKNTESTLDNIIISALKMPSVFWCIVIALYIGVAISEFPEKYIFYFNRSIHVILIFSITIACANLAGKIFRSYIQKSALPIPTTGLAYVILKGTILVIGFLIILSVLGISITPLITALGVGGLAIALALQDTLANLFAGIHILVEKSIKIGDYIKLETGQEGYVEDRQQESGCCPITW